MYSFKFVSLATFLGFLATSSAGKEAVPFTNVEVAKRLLTESFKRADVAISGYNGNVVSFAELGENYYYLPRLLPDWKSYQKTYDEVCKDKTDVEVNIQVEVGHYNSSILSEFEEGLAKKTKKKEVNFTWYPHYGRTYTLQVGAETSVLADSTLPPQGFLGDHLISNTIPLDRAQTLNVTLACEQHAGALNYKDMTAYFHMQGAEVTESSINFKSVFSNVGEIFADIENTESEKQEVFVKNTAKSGGFGLKIGPLKLGGDKAEVSTSTKIENLRIVDRDWITERVADRIGSIEITEICSGGVNNCVPENIRDSLLSFILTGTKEQVARIENSDGLNKLIVGNLEAPVETVTIDEELKSKLEASRTSDTGTKVKYKDVEIEKTDKGTSKVNNDITFVHKGSDWVPTEFSVYMVDRKKLNDRINAQYTRLITTGPLRKVSRQVHDITTSNLPPNFVSAMKWETPGPPVTSYDVTVKTANVHKAGTSLTLNLDYRVGTNKHRVTFSGKSTLLNQNQKSNQTIKVQGGEQIDDIILSFDRSTSDGNWLGDYVKFTRVVDKKVICFVVPRGDGVVAMGFIGGNNGAPMATDWITPSGSGGCQ